MYNLEITNLAKKYENFALKNLNIKLKAGKIIGLIGENGSGKTTTIKAILNLIKIDDGTIKIFEKNNNLLTKNDKEQLGVVLDDSFFCNLYKIADINKVMKNIYTSWNEKQFYQYINEFKVPIDKMYKEFSSGTKMKVKLICAICHNSKLLILDEATNGLDPIIRYDILNLFTKFVANKKNSILISTHITTDLEHIADEIIFINEGKIILDKDMNYLQEHYGLVKCSKEDFKKINQDDYFKNLKYKDECWVLIENKKLFANNYPKLNINIPSIEELMLLFIKGE